MKIQQHETTDANMLSMQLPDDEHDDGDECDTQRDQPDWAKDPEKLGRFLIHRRLIARLHLVAVAHVNMFYRVRIETDRG